MHIHERYRQHMDGHYADNWSDRSVGKSVEELRSNKNSSSAPKSERPASQKQIYFLETLMGQHGTTVDAMNKYVSQQYGIDDYRKISSFQASQLIERYKSLS